MRLLTHRILLVVLTLGFSGAGVGCDIGWADVPGAKIYAEVPSDPTGHALTWWGPEVRLAAEDWARLLGPGCESPFRFQDAPSVDAHPVRLLHPWPHDDGDMGLQTDEGIDVRSTLPQLGRRMILMHELGHALGLRHNEDSNGIMRYGQGAVTEPNARELGEARALLGCSS